MWANEITIERMVDDIVACVCKVHYIDGRSIVFTDICNGIIGLTELEYWALIAFKPVVRDGYRINRIPAHSEFKPADWQKI